MRSLGDHLLDLLIGQLRMRVGRVGARRLEQLLVIIGLQVAIAEWAVKFSSQGKPPSILHATCRRGYLGYPTIGGAMRRKKEFGPNQGQVDALLERLETVDQGQALFLANLAGDDPERHAAREAMIAAARRGHRERELHDAQHEVTRWVNMWFTGGFQISGYGRDVTPGEAAVGAAPVILDAVGGLVVRDLLADVDFETLIGPWRMLDSKEPPPE